MVEEINLLLYRLRRKLGAGANISKPAAAGAASRKSADANIVFGVFLFCNETVISPLYFSRPAIAKKSEENYTWRNALMKKMLVFLLCLLVLCLMAVPGRARRT